MEGEEYIEANSRKRKSRKREDLDKSPHIYTGNQIFAFDPNGFLVGRVEPSAGVFRIFEELREYCGSDY